MSAAEPQAISPIARLFAAWRAMHWLTVWRRRQLGVEAAARKYRFWLDRARATPPDKP